MGIPLHCSWQGCRTCLHVVVVARAEGSRTWDEGGDIASNVAAFEDPFLRPGVHTAVDSRAAGVGTLDVDLPCADVDSQLRQGGLTCENVGSLMSEEASVTFDC